MSVKRTARIGSVLALGCAIAVVSLAAPAPSHAAGGVNADALQAGALPPVGAGEIDAATYAALFAGLPSDPPAGTIVADSGFRPFPNGFTFLNYGASLEMNQELFGQPLPLAEGGKSVAPDGLTANSMRRVFGDGVCLWGSGSDCRLTESAKVVRSTANSWAAAGRCFGLATVANALYTGRLSEADVRGGEVNALTTLNASTQQAIMRAFMAQYFSAVGFRPSSMADAVSRLRAALAPGRIPFTMLIYGAPGGHALVPYAVLDKGDGLFDIAVYDPNLPNQARAVHVDTLKNSWTFTSAPGLGESTWNSADTGHPAYFLFGDVESALAKQTCTFCQTGKSATIVSFSAVLSVNRGIYDHISLHDRSGNPLPPDSYRVVLPTDQPSSLYSSGPVFLVDRGVNFTINLDGQSVQSAQPFVVKVIANASTRSLQLETLNPDVRGRIGVSGRNAELTFAGESTNQGTATHTYEDGAVSYKFQGIQGTKFHPEALGFRSYQSGDRIIFEENDAFSATWAIKIASETSRSGSGYRAEGIKVRSGSRLIVTFRGWKGASGAPRLWLDEFSDGTLDRLIPLRRV